LDEDNIFIQSFWNPRVHDRIEYTGYTTSIRSIDKKYPSQINILNDNGKEEVAYLQDCTWVFNEKDLNDILGHFSLVVIAGADKMRIKDVKGFYPKPTTLREYVWCICNVRHIRKMVGEKDPINDLLLRKVQLDD